MVFWLLLIIQYRISPFDFKKFVFRVNPLNKRTRGLSNPLENGPQFSFIVVADKNGFFLAGYLGI
ncbi:hypothetical protein WI87_22325 [Burkholderia ubonensis]|nr:hypothetical protein WI87_22325 [Burkholderia ubonensis]